MARDGFARVETAPQLSFVPVIPALFWKPLIMSTKELTILVIIRENRSSRGLFCNHGELLYVSSTLPKALCGGKVTSARCRESGSSSLG